MKRFSLILALSMLGLQFPAFAQEAVIRVMDLKADPYGAPRPAFRERNVPLRTSFFFQLSLDNAAAGDLFKRMVARGAEGLDRPISSRPKRRGRRWI